MINKDNIQTVLATLGFVRDLTRRWVKPFDDGFFGGFNP